MSVLKSELESKGGGVEKRAVALDLHHVMGQMAGMLVFPSSFQPVGWVRNGHVQTVAGLWRPVPRVAYERESIDTEDGDFLDLDWLRTGARRLAVVTHGLEGSSRGTVAVCLAHAFQKKGWDVVAWNFRGCGGRANRRPRWTHAGATDDLATVVRHAAHRYDRYVVVGASLGGNLVLHALGQGDLPIQPAAAAVFCAPCDLEATAHHLARIENSLYQKYFIKRLIGRMRCVESLLPSEIRIRLHLPVKNFAEFDRRFTAPLHGFESVEAYWRTCSSGRVLEAIEVPTLIVNAVDDPVIPVQSHPIEQARHHRWVDLELPGTGGHAGFWSGRVVGGFTWLEYRLESYLAQFAPPSLAAVA